MATVLRTIGPSGRDYSTFTAWEADLDNAGIYAAGDDAIGEADAGTYNESFTQSGGSGLNSITLRPKAGDEHGGVPGAGVRLVPPSSYLVTTPNAINTWQDLELDFNGGSGSSAGIHLGGTDTVAIRRLLIHGIDRTSLSCDTVFLNTFSAGADFDVDNCVIYDVQAATVIGISGGKLTDDCSVRVRNNTVTGLTGTTDAYGIENFDNANTEYSNNLVTSITGGACWLNSSFTSATAQTNGSDDATSPNSGLRNLTIAFNDAANDDYSLASSDTDAIDVGTDLGAITAAIDITGRNRDTEGDTWDLGAYEFVSNSISGTLAKTLGALTASAQATVPIEGTANKALDALVAAAAGTVPISATFNKALANLTLFAQDSNQIDGTLAKTFEPLTLDGLSPMEVSGSLQQAFAPVTLASLNSLPLAGTLAKALDPASLLAQSSLPISGTSNNILAALLLTALSEMPLAGITDEELEELTLAGQAAVGSLEGTLDVELAPLILGLAASNQHFYKFYGWFFLRD